ncbi:phosphotransferase [Qipengyuania gaetbuli]|uniref:phosphotransferase n=1 Tax=Qipengyuania gaetbuli TaxID=266952 RepID=UPI001CD5CD9D|nr:phosphotransferase [Qipengyuania gaetbuli]MCA0911028.1 aminoglycoside phosphotransferase family protein [Qipengyuania gaetbuli]
MLQPVNWSSGLAKSWSQLMALFGPRSFVGPERINLKGQPDIGTDFGGEAESFAYFTGTSGPHRKSTIQVMDCHGRILGYAKLSRREPVRKFIDREAKLLERIAGLGLVSAVAPEVLVKRSSDSYSLLVTDAAREKRSKAAMPFGDKHLRFLRELHSVTVHEGAQSLLARLKEDVASIEASLDSRWIQRFRHASSTLGSKAPHMLVSLAHGDFTPWNCFELNSKLYVFDWEYAALNYPLGYDQLHFQIAAAQGHSPAKFLNEIQCIIARDWFGGEVAAARLAILLSLVIHAVFYFRRSHDAGDQRLEFEGEQFRGQLIDSLLVRMPK